MITYTKVKLKDPENIEKVSLPAVLTIAGSDSSGGAGIEADLKTFSAHKVYGLSCISALTGQNTQLVKSFEKTPEYLLRDILDLNFNDFLEGYDNLQNTPLKAIKTGMLTKETIEVLKEHFGRLREKEVKIIVDPVMISTSGSQLFDEDGMKICVDGLLKEAYLATPNFMEAKALMKIASGNDMAEPGVQNLDDYTKFVVDLQSLLGCKNILVKGGHIPWDVEENKPFAGDVHNTKSKVSIIDILYESQSETITVFESNFLNSKDTHGTGCTLSSSIAANIAKGLSLQEALPLSINYVQKSMLSLSKKLGHGNGPLNHNVTPAINISSVCERKETDISHYLLDSYDSFLDYLKTHPKVKENWKTYTEHSFLSQLAENKLPFNKFLYYLKQDYYYLVNYAQIHGLAASVAKDYRQIHTQSVIIDEIVKEIEGHRAKLMKNYNIHYERDFGRDLELAPGKACLAYCDYLLAIGRKEDFLGIKIALAPCLHGYAEAGEFGLNLRQKHDKSLGALENQSQSDIYDSWLADYTSDWYIDAYERGKESLQLLLENYSLSQQRLDELIDIFNKVTILEINFWDEVLN